MMRTRQFKDDEEAAIVAFFMRARMASELADWCAQYKAELAKVTGTRREDQGVVNG